MPLPREIRSYRTTGDYSPVSPDAVYDPATGKYRKPDENYSAYMGGVEDYASTGYESSGNMLERELAKLRMRLGYNQSAGAGTGGWWNLAKLGMETAGMGKQLDLQQQWQMWEAQQKSDWAKTQDAQAHQAQMMRLQGQQQLMLMQQQAELNDASWWESFGSIIGMGLGIWGMAGFQPFWQSWFNSGNTGGIVGQGVGGSWSAGG